MYLPLCYIALVSTLFFFLLLVSLPQNSWKGISVTSCALCELLEKWVVVDCIASKFSQNFSLVGVTCGRWARNAALVVFYIVKAACWLFILRSPGVLLVHVLTHTLSLSPVALNCLYSQNIPNRKSAYFIFLTNLSLDRYRLDTFLKGKMVLNH